MAESRPDQGLSLADTILGVATLAKFQRDPEHRRILAAAARHLDAYQRWVEASPRADAGSG